MDIKKKFKLQESQVLSSGVVRLIEKMNPQGLVTDDKTQIISNNMDVAMNKDKQIFNIV